MGIGKRAASGSSDRVTRSVVGIAALACLAVGGCTAGGRPPATAPEPAIGNVVRVADPSQASRPLDAYRPLPTQLVALARAQARLVTQCYAASQATATFELGPNLVEFIGNPVVRDAEFSELWGFFSPNTAATHGYHLPNADQGSLASAPSGDVPPDVASRCYDDSIKAMPFEKNWGSFAVVPNAPGLPVAPLPSNDSRVVAAAAAWKACMNDAGFQVAGPVEAMVDQKWNDPSPSAAEEAQASADLACKTKTNLVGIDLAVLEAYDRQYIETNRVALDNYKATIDDFLRSH